MTVDYGQVSTADDYDRAHAAAAQQVAVNAAACASAPEVTVASPSGPVPWTSGLFDCCSYGNLCCNVFWCEPCMLARNHSAVVADAADKMDLRVCGGLVGVLVTGYALGIALDLATHEEWLVAVAEGVGYCVVSAYTMWQRGQVRQKYGIAGDSCGDCLVAFFCTPCSAAQHHLELGQRGVNPGSVCCEVVPPAPPAGQPGYAAARN